MPPHSYSAGVPSGKAHLVWELSTLPGWVALGGALGVTREQLVLFSLTYVGASLLLSPDLDLQRSAPARRWGVARFMWAPYAAVFRHRGISHSPLLGPLTRLIYLALVGGAVWVILHLVGDVRFPRTIPTGSVLSVLGGVYLPHVLHVVLDRVTTVLRWPAS